MAFVRGIHHGPLNSPHKWPVTQRMFPFDDVIMSEPCLGGRRRPLHDCRCRQHHPWLRHQMEAFSALLTICMGNSPVTGELPAQRPVTRSLDVFFDLRLNKRLSKQSWGWWFETLSRKLWRHCKQWSFNKNNANSAVFPLGVKHHNIGTRHELQLQH